MGDYLELLHTKHWIKNGFVLAPVIFSFQFMELQFSVKTLFAFLSFCLSSSSVYIFNCIRDRKSDLVHPVKKKRPIAAGRISVGKAAFLALALLVPAFIFNLLCNINVLLVIIAYILMNVLYSTILKDVPILDVIIVAFGFLLRILAGSYAIGVYSSDWILLTTFFLALCMGFAKRRSEYLVLGSERSEHRAVFRYYSKEMLDGFILISATLAIISYALYAINPLTTERFGQSRMVFTVPFVLFGILRYLMLTYLHKKDGDPVDIILRDKSIIVVTLLWILLIMLIIMTR